MSSHLRTGRTSNHHPSYNDTARLAVWVFLPSWRLNRAIASTRSCCSLGICKTGKDRLMRMLSRPALAFSLVLASGVALPSFAQTPSAGNATTAPATHEMKTPSANATSPSQRNAVLTDRGDVRASKLIGSAVYNDRDEKVGSVDDVIMGKDNKADVVIVSVGGFLGMGTKLVSVPYTELKLGDTKNASSSNKVVMPGATKELLKAQPEFHHTNRG
jgi:sporulation protein YlmC with PRC-barrel domain